MKILIDHQGFSMQKYGGVSRVFAELIKYLKIKNVQVATPNILLENEYYLKILNKKSVFYRFNKNKYVQKFQKVLLPFINEIYTKYYIKNKNVDIYFPTYYNPYLINKIDPSKCILFVYDMIHELYPELFKNNQKNISNKKKWLDYSNKIIAISNNTKLDILKLYPEIKPEKIEVIYLSHSLNNNENIEIKNKLPSKYILFVGTRTYYKNFKTLLIAYSIIFKNNKDIFLVCVGGGSFNNEEFALIEELQLENYIKQMNVSDNDLYTVYHNAFVFVFPSLYEGFGIPILESMYSQCPVILGETSSFPEVAGDAGIYCDITNPIDIASKIEYLLFNPNYRKDIIEKGKQRCILFSWELFGKKVFNLCKSLN